jgi:gag-polyprotein putative aspartyl protease
MRNLTTCVQLKTISENLADSGVNGTEVTFEVDTGTGVTLMTRKVWQIIGCPVLTATKLQFRSYSGHRLRILEYCETNVAYQGKQFQSMPAYVVDSTRTSLLGRTWLDRMKLDIRHCRREGDIRNSLNVNVINDDNAVNEVVQEFSALFDGSLGCIKDTKLVYK